MALDVLSPKMQMVTEKDNVTLKFPKIIVWIVLIRFSKGYVKLRAMFWRSPAGEYIKNASQMLNLFFHDRFWKNNELFSSQKLKNLDSCC